MTKTLTEQWREGKLPENTYYVQFICGRYGIYEFEQFKGFGFDNDLAYIKEVLAPVPDYGSLYNPNDGSIPVGLFTVLKLIKRDIERWQTTRHLTDLECGIKSQVVSLLKRRGWDLGKDELVSKTYESFGNTEQLKKQLAIATKALKDVAYLYIYTDKDLSTVANNALKEIEG